MAWPLMAALRNFHLRQLCNSIGYRRREVSPTCYLHWLVVNDYLVTGHFGHKILRHQDTLGHFGTGLKTLRHQKRGTRHFDTNAVIEEKLAHFDPGQFRWDTTPPVLNFGTNFVVPKCLVAEVSGSRLIYHANQESLLAWSRRRFPFRDHPLRSRRRLSHR